MSVNNRVNDGRGALAAFGDHKNACGNGGFELPYFFRFTNKDAIEALIEGR